MRDGFALCQRRNHWWIYLKVLSSDLEDQLKIIEQTGVLNRIKEKEKKELFSEALLHTVFLMYSRLI